MNPSVSTVNRNARGCEASKQGAIDVMLVERQLNSSVMWQTSDNQCASLNAIRESLCFHNKSK